MESLELDIATERNLVTEFLGNYIDLVLEKKRLDKQIKMLRFKYEEQGVNTGLSIRAMNAVRQEKKAGQETMEKIQEIKDIILADTPTQEKIDTLDNKEL